MTQVKLCGMTRPEDADAASALGASFVGVIFAGGPRTLSVERAIQVLAPVRGRSTTIGVFGAAPAATIADIAAAAGLDGVQLHGDPTAADVEAVRRRFGGIVWAVYRVGAGGVGPEASELFAMADGVVLDARSEDALGGTGRTLPWRALSRSLSQLRTAPAALVLAGGLRPENVAEAAHVLAPDVVDVSSGVESSPGVKDHNRMRAFMDATRTAANAPRSI